ncbi:MULTISPECIES: DUF1772 domain-containing protein [unclassified Sinorhizobium]|uniref:DUF1772 domain-containing protein n=1 Tax=unclassified Sinorhizobium TaxID=2613772 RepID=UPI0024C23C53|nr:MULTISPECIES: DUF1772 domain-containing protein [unclassified Sinorhizobium]MDK1374688.1 DUF1772 domain-containing protein [Sinorhizobium sp. 6-70]MDK1481130.1 DUF1772 domain-containing protein [Sinorhizobium sp. 6-117]
MPLYLTALASLLLTALSLGPSFAHVLEAPPRLIVWSPELWREATVFNGQFELFAQIGGPIDIAAILVAALLTYLLAGERPAVWFALAGTCLLVLGLGAWFTLVAPVNAVLDRWTPGPIPSDFASIRLQWETGHMVVAALKFLAFASIGAAVLGPRLP